MPTNDALLPDLVCDSKIETTILGDVVKHIVDGSARSINERRARREERWVKQKLLGRGTYGAVYLQKRQEEGAETLRAVKEIQKCVAPGKDLEYIREIEAIMKFSHAKYQNCFVTSNGWYEDNDTVYIAMEFIELGDLRHNLTEALPEHETKQITAQVLEGLTFMHNNNFIHRDLKPANIMVVATAPNWFVKIADFGISKRRHHDATTNLTSLGGTLGFVAPEAIGIVSKGSYTYSVDMWSLGALAYRMLTNSVPFDGLSEIAQYAFGQISFPKDTEAFSLISQHGRDFIANLMQLNPRDRMCAASAAKHPWLAPYLETQSDTTIIDSFTGLGDELVEKDTEAPSSLSCSTEAMAVDTDGERTIRQICYGNYKSPFVSDCGDESNTHGGEKLAVNSPVLLEGPLKIMDEALRPDSPRVCKTEEDCTNLAGPFRTLSRQLSLGPGAEIRRCVACERHKFDFKCSSGHFMCTSCYNQELRLSVSNPQNVTHKCCISSSTYSEETFGINYDAEVAVKSDQARKDEPSIENDESNLDVAMEDNNTGASSGDASTPFGASKLRRRQTNEDRNSNQRDESEGRKPKQSPVLDQEEIFDDPDVLYEEYYDPTLDHDSDVSYESEDLPSRDEMRPGATQPTQPNPQNVACENCRSTRGPVETLPCQHKLCHACLVQFLALSLISPKFMNITCCDYPLAEIGQYCWRKILLDPRLNAAWERLRLVDQGWTCPSGHRPKHGSPLVTCGPVPLWRQAVKCSECLPSASALRAPDSRHLGNANFCLFCSKEVGSGGCKSCDYDRMAWEFIYRLKRSGALRVSWMAEDVHEACRVKKCLNHGETLDYQTLEDFKREAKATEPEPRRQTPPHTQNNTFTNPNTTYFEEPRQYHHPPRQNASYSYAQPHPNFAPRPQGFSHGVPPTWAPNYPPFNPTPYYGMQGQRTYAHDPYSTPGYHPRYSPGGRVSIISCCYCSGNHAVQPTDKIIHCLCGGRMCGVCYGPFGPCQYGCVNLGAAYA